MKHKAQKKTRTGRRSRLLRLVRVLAVAGVLLGGNCGTGQASNLLELGNSPVWNVVDSLLGLLVPSDARLTGSATYKTVSTTGNYLLGGLGSLTVTGTSSSKATLNINSNLLTTDGLLSDGLVTLSGNESSKQGILNIALGNSLTSGGLVDIKKYGLLDIAGAVLAQKGVNIAADGHLILRTGCQLQTAAGSYVTLDGGDLLFRGADGLTLGNGILTNNLFLLKSGRLFADKLTLAGYTSSANIAADEDGPLRVNVNLLDLAGVNLNIGNATTDENTTVTINGAKAGETIPEFLGGNVTVKGYRTAHTLQLGAPGYTGKSNSAFNITLLGGNGVGAAADKALLKVDYGDFTVNNVTVGSTDGLNAGTVTINNSGSLTATNSLSINGGAGQPGLVTFGSATDGVNANTLKAKNLVVGGLLSSGVLDMATNAGKVIVDTAAGGGLVLGAGGRVNVNNVGSLLQFTGDWTVKQADLAAGGTAANGKIWLNKGALQVDGTLHTNGDIAASTGGQTVLGTTTSVGALDTGSGTLTLNAGKTTNILGLQGGKLLSGTVKVLGTGTAADTLNIGKNGFAMSAGNSGQGDIFLQGASADKAILNIAGNGSATSLYKMNSIQAGAASSSGSVNIDNASLELALLGLNGTSGSAAALNVGATAKASVNTNTLTLGSSTGKGNVSLLNASSLTAGTLNYDSSNGGLFVDNLATLNLVTDASFAGTNLSKGTSLVNGKVTLDSGAVMNVGGALHLTGAAPINVDVSGASINAQSLTAQNGGATQDMIWNGGNLTLYGSAQANPFITASKLDINGGAVQLGGPALAVGGTTLSSKGGSYAGPVTVNGGTLHVHDGAWTLSDTATGLNIKAANGLDVMNSTLNTAKLTVSSGASLDVGTGPGVGKLTVTGTTANDSLSSADAGSIKVHGNGVFQAAYGIVADAGYNLLASVKSFSVDSGGTLLLNGSGTITSGQYASLKDKLLGVGSLGTLQLNGITISDAITTLAQAIGLNLPTSVLAAVNGDTVTATTTVKGLTGPGTADIGISVTGGEFRMVGDASPSSAFLFSDNGAFKSNFTVENGAMLTLGNAAGTAPTYGTLNGDVTLNNGAFNAVNGVFATGALSGQGNVNVSEANLELASLSLTGGSVTVNQNGSLLANNDSSLFNLALDNGSFTTAVGKNLTVSGELSLINSSTLSVGQDLNLSPALTASIGQAQDSTIEVRGAFNAAVIDLNGSNLTLNVGGTLSVKNFTGDKGSDYQLGSLAASGLTTIDNASTLNVSNNLSSQGLTVDHGGSVTAMADAAVNGSLQLGPGALSTMTVGGNLSGVTTATVDNGSTLDVTGAMTSSGLTRVDKSAILNVGGVLSTGDLTVDKGAIVSARSDANIGALSLGSTAMAQMIVGGKLSTAAASLDNQSALSISGILSVSGTLALERGAVLTAGDDLFTIGDLTVDNGANLDARGNATVGGKLSVGPTAKARMSVAKTLAVTGTSSVDHASFLDVTGGFTSNGTSVQNGAILHVGGDASTGDLDIGSAAMAWVSVGGKLNSGMVTMTNGSTLDVLGAMTSSGAVTVDKGAMLTADSLSLLGAGPASTLGVGSTDASANVNLKTLNVGDSTSQGRVTLANGTLNTDVLNNNTTNGGILVQGAGVLNVSGNLNLAAQDLISAKVLQTGKIALDGGSLNIGGELALTGGAAISAGVGASGGSMDGVVRAQTVSALNSASPAALTWNGGNLVLFGDGTSFVKASNLAVTGGSIQLGAADRTVGSAQLSAKGGTFSGPLAVTGGALKVVKGDWTLTDTVAGLSITTAQGLDVNGGSLSTAKLSISGSGSALIGGGTSLGTVQITGGAGSMTSLANSVDIENNGLVLASFDTVAKSTIARRDDVGQFDVNTGGSLALTGLASITLADYELLRMSLINGSGLLDLRGTIVTDVNENTRLTDVLGTSLPETVVVAANGDNVNQSTTVKGLSVTPPGVSDIALTVSAGELRLVGDKSDQNFQLSQNGGKQSDITVNNGASLALGNPTGSVPTYGTLNGDITLNGELKADNGTFTVGNVIGGATAKGLTVNNASLNTGKLDLSGATNSVVTVNNGSLTASQDSLVQSVNLNHGSLATTGTANLTISGPASLSNASALNVGGDLTFTGPALTAADSSISTGGAFNAAGRTINGSNLSMTVGGALTVGTLTGDLASRYTADSLNASGDVTLDRGSTLQTAHNAAITGALSLGPTAAAQFSVGGDFAAGSAVTVDNASVFSVRGAMTSKGPTLVNNGSSAVVGGAFTPGGTVAVQGGSSLNTGSLNTNNQLITVGNASGQGGSLTTGELNTSQGGAIIVDPTDGKAFLGVATLTGGNLETLVEVGRNGIASFGSSSRQVADNQIAASGVTASSVLLLSSPLTLKGAGQLLVGEKYQKAPNQGIWDSNPAKDPYALALRGSSLLLADMSNVPTGGSLIKIDAGSTSVSSNGAAVLIEPTAAIRLTQDSGLKNNTTYTLVSGLKANSVLQAQGGTPVANGQTLTLNGGLTTNNLLVNLGGLTYNAASGTLEAKSITPGASLVLPGLDGGLAGLLDNLAVTGFDVQHPQTGIRFLSRATDRRYIADEKESARTIEGAARLSALGAAPAMTKSASDAAVAAVDSRMSSALRPLNRGVSMGLSGGDGWKLNTETVNKGLAVWFAPLYQWENVHDMSAGSFKTGYTADFGGGALGTDYTMIMDNDVLRFGAAFNVGGGNARSKGDFNTVLNDFNFWGLSLYGKWAHGNFALNGDVGYTQNDNSLKQDLPSGMQMESLKAEFDSSAITAGLRAEYTFTTPYLDITPHVGARYMNLVTDSHSVNSGDSVFTTDRDSMDIWTFPVGVAVYKNWQLESGWNIKPTLDFSLIPATGDLKAHNRVRVPGLAGGASLQTDVMDELTASGSLGVELKNDSIRLGLDYNIQVSDHRIANGIFASFRLAF